VLLRIRRSGRFKRNVKRVDKEVISILRTKLEIFVKNPFHPSLGTKKIKHSDRIYELRINRDIRVTWQYDKENEDTVILRNIGYHDKTIKNS